MKKIIPLAWLIVAILPGVASAAIVGLFNTGTDSLGNVLGDNAIDPHYTIMSGPIAGDAIVATSAQGSFPLPPFGPWTPDSTTSAWIAPSENTQGPGGDYIYSATFTVSDSATDVINGGWSTDNGGVDILINGMSLGLTTSITSFATPFDLFSINMNNGLVDGVNTLEFVVNNISGPTGLRVEFTASVIPLPATIWLFGSGLLALLASRRNKTA